MSSPSAPSSTQQENPPSLAPGLRQRVLSTGVTFSKDINGGNGEKRFWGLTKPLKPPDLWGAGERWRRPRASDWLLAPLSLPSEHRQQKPLCLSEVSSEKAANRERAAHGGGRRGRRGEDVERRQGEPGRDWQNPGKSAPRGWGSGKQIWKHYPTRSPLKTLSGEALRDPLKRRGRSRDLRAQPFCEIKTAWAKTAHEEIRD